MNAPPDE